MTYPALVRENLGFLGFGLLLTAAASFGQTFFIALYMGEVREAFGLSHGDAGNLYLAGTVASGTAMIWLGRLADAVPLRRLAMAVTCGLALGCLIMAWTPLAWSLGLAFFLLRLFGQGLMTHTAITATVRRFGANRGKAVGIVSLGQPLAEGVLPLLAVALMASLGWRLSWALFAGLLVLLAVPAIHALLAHETAVHPTGVQAPGPDTGRAGVGRHWSRAEVLRDARFYLLLPGFLAPAYVSTGLIFHQAHIAEVRGWSLAWIAICFLGYAAAKGLAAFLLGPLVDRWSARRVARFVLAPMALAAAVLAALPHEFGALAYLTLLGAASGATHTTFNAIWAELYGTRHLGQIRGFGFALAVWATALAPASMGWWIDAGTQIETIAWGSALYVLAAMLPLNVALSLRR